MSPGNDHRRLAIAWVAMAAPIGTLGFLVTRLSDHPDERRVGDLWLVLAVGSVVLGLALVRSSTPARLATSYLLSGLWVGAAAVAVLGFDFPSDRLLVAGPALLVAVVTAVLGQRGRAGT